MADFRISQLPELAQGDVALDDVLPVTDVSASETKKITVENLIADGVAAVPDGTIPLSKVDVAGGTLDASNLEPGSITGGVGGHIADSTIDANNLKDGAIVDAAVTNVSGAKLLDGTVSPSKLQAGISGSLIADGSITAAKLTGQFSGGNLEDGAVDTAEIADGAVTTAKLGDAAVTDEKVAVGISGSKLTDGTVSSAKLGTNIDGAKLADASVTADKLSGEFDGTKLADGSVNDAALATGIDGAKLLDDSVPSLAIESLTGGKLLDGTVTDAKLATGIDGAKIADGSITPAKVTGKFDATHIEDGSVLEAALGDGSVTTAKLGDLAVTSEKVAAGLSGGKLGDGTVTNAKLAAGIDGAKLLDGSVPATKLIGTIDSGNLGEGAVDTAEIADGAVTGPKLAAGAVTTDKVAAGLSGGVLADGSVTDAKLATGIDGAKLKAASVPTSALADPYNGDGLIDESVGTAKLIDGAVTTAKLADGAVTDAKVGTDISGTKLADGTVSDDKITSLDGAKLTDGSVTGAKLASGIDGAKLADGTVANGALAGGITGDKLAPATVTADKIVSVDGSTITAGTTPADRLDETTLNRSIDLDDNGNLGIANEIVAGTTSGITYNAQGLITATTALVGSDLPIATEVAVGGVSIPVGGGLEVTPTGELSIEDVIVPTSASGITVNAKGQVTVLRPLIPGDLPIATNSQLGAVQISSDGGLVVDVNGNLSCAQSPAGTGPHTKVITDEFGHVVASQALTDADLPSAISADKITLGQLESSQIADDAINGAHLADYSTCYLQNADPGKPDDVFIGKLWYQVNTGGLYIYVGGSGPSNVWLPLNSAAGGGGGGGGDVSLALNDLTDVVTTGASNGQVLTYTNGTWSAQAVQGGGGGEGGIPEAPNDGKLYGRQNNTWQEVTSTGTGGEPGVIDPEPGGPANPENGSIWLDLEQCPPVLKIWSDCDGGGGSWNEISGGSGGGGEGPTGLQEGDNISLLVNDAGYQTEANVTNILNGLNPDGSVPPDTNGGYVPMGSWADVPDLGTTTRTLQPVMTPVVGARGSTDRAVVYLQPGDPVSYMTNDVGYCDEAAVVNVANGLLPDGSPNPDGDGGFIPLGDWADFEALP